MNKKLLAIFLLVILLCLLSIIFSLNSKIDKLETKLEKIPTNSDFDYQKELPEEDNKGNFFEESAWYYITSDIDGIRYYADKSSIVKIDINSPNKIFRIQGYNSKTNKEAFITFDCDNKTYWSYNRYIPIAANSIIAPIYNFACGDFSSTRLEYIGNHINQVKEEITDLSNNKKCESYGKKLISCSPFSCTLTIGSGINKYRIESKIKGLDKESKCIEEVSSSKDSTKTICKYTISSRRFLGSKYWSGPLFPIEIKGDQEKYNKIQADECKEIEKQL